MAHLLIDTYATTNLPVDQAQLSTKMFQTEARASDETDSSSSSPKKTSRMQRRFDKAKKLDSAVDFVKSTTADQKLPNGPSPPIRMGAPPSVEGFSETFVTSIFSQAIVQMDESAVVTTENKQDEPMEKFNKSNSKK